MPTNPEPSPPLRRVFDGGAPEFLTVPEAAQLVGVTRQTIYNLIRKGCLQTREVDGTSKLDRESLKDYRPLGSPKRTG